jgi:hypothetical protein
VSRSGGLPGRFRAVPARGARPQGRAGLSVNLVSLASRLRVQPVKLRLWSWGSGVVDVRLRRDIQPGIVRTNKELQRPEAFINFPVVPGSSWGLFGCLVSRSREFALGLASGAWQKRYS